MEVTQANIDKLQTIADESTEIVTSKAIRVDTLTLSEEIVLYKI